LIVLAETSNGADGNCFLAGAEVSGANYFRRGGCAQFKRALLKLSDAQHFPEERNGGSVIIFGHVGRNT
jgi:hypothetical protein